VPDTPVKLKTIWGYDCIPPEYKDTNGMDYVAYYCSGDVRTHTLNKNDGAFVGESEIVGTPVFYNNHIYHEPPVFCDSRIAPRGELAPRTTAMAMRMAASRVWM